MALLGKLDPPRRGVLGLIGRLVFGPSGRSEDVLHVSEDAPGLQELIEQAEQVQQTIQSALSRFEIPKTERREAARRLVLGTLLFHLSTLSRLLRRNTAVSPELIATLGKIVEQLRQLVISAEGDPSKEGFYRHAYRETAWELALRLRCALLEIGDGYYLLTLLQEELQLDREPEATQRWSDYYDSSQLHELMTALEATDAQQSNSNADRQYRARVRAAEMLTRLYQARNDADREHRAQETLRVVRLRWTCRFLGLALLAMAILYGVIFFPESELSPLLVGLALGPAALGGVLGSVRKLREEPLVSRSGEQPRYRWAFYAQLLVSGTLGLLILALASLEILPFPVNQQNEIDWRDTNTLVILSLYTFLAGFSEAFAFSFLQRFATGGAV